VQTLKTAVVVVLLLVVFYGVYEMLNRPPVEAPPSVADLPPDVTDDLQIDMGDAFDPGSGPSSGPTDDLTIVTDPAGDSGETDSLSGEGHSHFAPSAPDLDASIPEPPGGAFSPAAEQPPQASETNEPPSQTNEPPVAPPTMTADAEVYGTPSGSQVQVNPHFSGEAVPKPRVASSGRAQLGSTAYIRARNQAQTLVDEGDFREALSKLSIFYKSPDLSVEQHRELLDLLDPLAGRVIYSRDHLLTRPYRVGRGETLPEIAEQFNIPYQLLQNINGIENPDVLLPGSELKIVPGPFSADVDLPGKELTLFVDGLYAGRFPITLGSDIEASSDSQLEGSFQVRSKQPGKTYFSMDGRTIPVDNPANPYGRVWLDLGREICIHGSATGTGEQTRGCISLSPRDADDVYGILSVGSKIRILR
jgi:LysM repeat protein